MSVKEGVFNKPDPYRIGFFDLPREVRDEIYYYIVIGIPDSLGHRNKCFLCPQQAEYCIHEPAIHGSECKACSIGSEWGRIISPRHLTARDGRCPVPDALLRNVSLTSKSMGSEFRPLFYGILSRVRLFHVEEEVLPRNELRFSQTRAFLRAFGTNCCYIQRIDVFIWSLEPVKEEEIKPALTSLSPYVSKEIVLGLTLKTRENHAITRPRYYRCRVGEGSEWIVESISSREHTQWREPANVKWPLKYWS